ncbi:MULTISPECIES: ABC-three component system middle component 4 [Vibrio harveyi group]
MMKLPFVEPDDDIYLNISVVLIIIYYLSSTKRGVLKMNNERIHLYEYLVRNPQKLSYVLRQLGKGNLIVNRDDYSISAISYNLDPLFDRDRMKYILTILSQKKLVCVSYKSKEGFMYSLTESGIKIVEELEGEYFSEIKLYAQQLVSTLSINVSQLNSILNQLITVGVV